MDQRLKLRKNLHKDFPVPFPDDSDLEMRRLQNIFENLAFFKEPKI